MLTLMTSGMLGRDPETRTYGDGKTMTRFSVAARIRGKDGPETVWVSVTAFGKLGELCAKYLKKKSRVLVTGTPTARVYTSKTEEVVASLDLVADDVEFLDGGQGSQDDSVQAPAHSAGFTPAHDTEVPF